MYQADRRCWISERLDSILAMSCFTAPDLSPYNVGKGTIADKSICRARVVDSGHAAQQSRSDGNRRRQWIRLPGDTELVAAGNAAQLRRKGWWQ